MSRVFGSPPSASCLHVLPHIITHLHDRARRRASQVGLEGDGGIDRAARDTHPGSVGAPVFGLERADWHNRLGQVGLAHCLIVRADAITHESEGVLGRAINGHDGEGGGCGRRVLTGVDQPEDERLQMAFLAK